MTFSFIAPYIKVLVFIHNLIILIIAILFPGEIPKYLLIVTIITHIYILVILHRAKAAFVLFFFMLTYLLFFIPYFFFGINMGLHVKYQDALFYEKTVQNWLLFLLTFLLVIKKKINKSERSILESIIVEYYPLRFYFLTVISLIFIMYLFTKGENLLIVSGNRYEIYLDNLRQIGGLSVLFFVVYIINVVYSDKSKFQRRILLFIAFLYLTFAISRGTRMLVASMGFVVYILLFENHFKTRSLIGLLVLSLVVLIGLNTIKNNILLQDYKFTIPNQYGQESILVNQTEILYGSAAVYGIIDENVLTLEERAKLSLGLVLTSIVPPSFLPRTHKYPAMVYEKTHIGGGGLGMTVVFIAYGYIGIILLAVYLAFTINVAYKQRKTSNLLRLFCLAVLCLSSRWFSYDLNVAYRLPIYTIILFSWFNSLFYTYKKYENRGRFQRSV